MEEKTIKMMKKDDCFHESNDELQDQSLKLQMIIDKQQRDIQVRANRVVHSFFFSTTYFTKVLISIINLAGPKAYY